MVQAIPRCVDGIGAEGIDERRLHKMTGPMPLPAGHGRAASPEISVAMSLNVAWLKRVDVFVRRKIEAMLTTTDCECEAPGDVATTPRCEPPWTGSRSLEACPVHSWDDIRIVDH